MVRTRSTAAIMQLSYDQKLKMVQAGLAVPGFKAEGAEASKDINRRLEEAGVRKKQASDSARTCTYDAPCELDGGDFLRSLALSPGGVVLLAAFAYTVGQRSFESEDDGWTERLERRAARSRERRIERQRDFARRLEPLQQLLGWPLVTEGGMPTAEAYYFLAAAVLLQLTLAAAVTSSIREALPL